MNQLLYHEMIDVTTASQRELALCNKPCPQYWHNTPLDIFILYFQINVFIITTSQIIIEMCYHLLFKIFVQLCSYIVNPVNAEWVVGILYYWVFNSCTVYCFCNHKGISDCKKLMFKGVPASCIDWGHNRWAQKIWYAWIWDIQGKHLWLTKHVKRIIKPHHWRT